MSTDWSKAECLGVGDLFYTPEVDARDEKNRDIRENLCKSICFTCPIRIDCLEQAVIDQESNGVWGGMTEAERRRFWRVLRKSPWMKNKRRASFRRAVRVFYEQEAEEFVTIGYRDSA